MRHPAQFFLNMLTLFQIIKPVDGGQKHRFMRRSLFYLPLLSIFLATLVRLFHIVYRLGDLSKCNLKINEILYDSSNNDFIFLDLNINGCSLPANCEFIKSSISLIKGTETLIAVDVGTFEVMKNAPINIRCPVKINNISLACFTDDINSSQLVLEFLLYIKVRFLLISIPISFKSKVKCNSNYCDTQQLIFGFYNHKLLGKLDNIKLRSQVTLKNMPEYINITHSKIIVESQIFKVHISPVIIRKGCLYKKLEVELQLTLDKSKKINELINTLVNRKVFYSPIDKINHCFLKQLFNGVVVCFDNTKSQKPKVFLKDEKNNKIINIYEFNDSYFEMLGINDEVYTQGRFEIELREKLKPDNEDINELVIQPGSTMPPLHILYSINTKLVPNIPKTNDVFIELIDINTISGYIFFTIKIDLIKFYHFKAISIDNSLIIFCVSSVFEKIVVPVIVTIKGNFLFATIILNEEQVEKLLKILTTFKEIVIKICDDCVFFDLLRDYSIVVKDNELQILYDKRVLYAKNLFSSDGKLTNIFIKHKLVKDDGKTLTISSIICDEFFNENDGFLNAKSKRTNIKITGTNLAIEMDMDLISLACTYSMLSRIVLTAVSNITILNLNKNAGGNLYEHILQDGIFMIKINDNFEVRISLSALSTSNDEFQYRLPKINFIEKKNHDALYPFSGTIEKEERGLLKYNSWKITNVFELKIFNFFAFEDNEIALELGANDLEVTCCTHSDGLYFYISKQAFIYVKVLKKIIVVDHLSIDYTKKLLLKVINCYSESNEETLSSSQQTFFKWDSLLKFYVKVNTNHDLDQISLEIKVNSEAYSPIKHQISLLERRINVYKNNTCYNLYITKKLNSTDLQDSIFMDCKIVESTKYAQLLDTPVVEIINDSNDVLVCFKLPKRCDTSLKNEFLGHLHFERVAVKKHRTFLNIDCEGFINDVFITKTLSHIIIRTWRVLQGQRMPRYVFFDVHINKLPLIMNEANDRRASWITLTDLKILYEIDLVRYCQATLSNKVEDDIITRSDFINGKHSVVSNKCQSMVTDHHLPLDNLSVLYFIFSIQITTYDSEIIINIPIVKPHPLLSLFYNEQNEKSPVFKIKFIRKRLFMISLHYKFKITYKEVNSVFLEVREGYKVFLQFLINPKPINEFSEDFYIFGYTSFNVLYHDYTFLLKRMFHYPLIIDIKKQGGLTIRSRIVYKIHSLLNLAFIPIGFVDLLVYSSSAFNMYKCFKEWRIFGPYTVEEENLSDEALKDINNRVISFERALLFDGS